MISKISRTLIMQYFKRDKKNFELDSKRDRKPMKFIQNWRKTVTEFCTAKENTGSCVLHSLDNEARIDSFIPPSIYSIFLSERSPLIQCNSHRCIIELQCCACFTSSLLIVLVNCFGYFCNHFVNTCI